MKLFCDTRWTGIFGGLAAMGWLCLSLPPSSGGETRSEWLTGSAWQEKLAQPADVFWQSAPLRESLESFSRAHRVAVLIDRRVDPGEELNLKFQRTAVVEILRETAAAQQLGFCLFDPVAYFGPERITRQLRTVRELRREESRRLPRAAARKFAQARPLRWDDFATPRGLLAELASSSEVEISGLDRVPHDLWAGVDLPSLSLSDRLTLILGQFDLTFQIARDGTAITLVPIPPNPVLVRNYPGGRDPQRRMEQWAARAPDSQFKIVGQKIFVKGRLEDHERIDPSHRPANHATPPPGLAGKPAVGGTSRDRFTTRVVNLPLGKILPQLASELHVELGIDRQSLKAAGISLDQLVSFNVVGATLDELFDAVLLPAGCRWQRKGNTIEIYPAAK